LVLLFVRPEKRGWVFPFLWLRLCPPGSPRGHFWVGLGKTPGTVFWGGRGGSAQGCAWAFTFLAPGPWRFRSGGSWMWARVMGNLSIPTRRIQNMGIGRHGGPGLQGSFGMGGLGGLEGGFSGGGSSAGTLAGSGLGGRLGGMPAGFPRSGRRRPLSWVHRARKLLGLSRSSGAFQNATTCFGAGTLRLVSSILARFSFFPGVHFQGATVFGRLPGDRALLYSPSSFGWRGPLTGDSRGRSAAGSSDNSFAPAGQGARNSMRRVWLFLLRFLGALARLSGKNKGGVCAHADPRLGLRGTTAPNSGARRVARRHRPPTLVPPVRDQVTSRFWGARKIGSKLFFGGGNACP